MKKECHGKPYSVSIKIPPFGGVFFKSWGKRPEKRAEDVAAAKRKALREETK